MSVRKRVDIREIARFRRVGMDTIQMMGAMDLSDLEATTDAALVVAIGRWRQEALAEAYRRHGGPVFALALRVLRQTALAEEVVQEIFVRLWYQPEKFDPMRGSLRSFLLAYAHGRSIDLLRSENSRRQREHKEANVVRHEYDLAQDVVDLAVSAEVRKAVDSLADKEKQAIQLAYYGGRSYREVAQLLGEPEGTIKSRIRIGLQRLRLALGEAGIGET